MRQIAISLLFAASVASASAQLAIDWFTIDGGGGTSTNGSYVLSGTIGQADAGAATGSGYSIAGGFWPGVQAMQIPGGPFLKIVRSGANVTVSWPPATPGFVLQQSSALAPMDWQNAPSGVTNPITIPANAASRYYRLLKP